MLSELGGRWVTYLPSAYAGRHSGPKGLSPGVDPRRRAARWYPHTTYRSLGARNGLQVRVVATSGTGIYSPRQRVTISIIGVAYIV